MKYTNFTTWHNKQLENPSYKKEFDALTVEFDLIRQIIKRRMESDMTQVDLAKKMRSDQAIISRLESGNYNPSIKFLKRLAHALGTKLKVSLIN